MPAPIGSSNRSASVFDKRMFSMNRRIVRVAIALLGLFSGFGLFSASSGAQQFSADLVDLTADGSRRELGESGKLFVSGGKIRIDRADASGTRFVVDTEKPAASVVAPMQRLYMDAKQSSILTELFVPVDPDAPCTQWQAMATLAGDTGKDGGSTWRCEMAGSEDLNGRPVVKLAMTSPGGVRRTGWIDAKLKFLVKAATADGAIIELRNIVEAPQPGGLFEIAAGFRKYDTEQLLARVKQSDVWVEPIQ
jgi:hypothetical protein